MGILMHAFENTLAGKGMSFFGRPAGSTVEGLDVTNGEAVVAFLKEHNWVDATDVAEEMGVRYGQCLYYRAEITAPYRGLEGIALASELSDEELAGVRLVRGHHGELEFQMSGLKPRPTPWMHIIVGSLTDFPNGVVTRDDCQVLTWYPGRLTRAVDLGPATVKASR
jgi:hypothetical protein